MKKNRKITDAQVLEYYSLYKSIYRVAQEFGVCPQTVHGRLRRLGCVLNGHGKPWTNDDSSALIKFYSVGFLCGDGSLEKFAEDLGRTKQFICRKAKELGLTNKKRLCSDAEKERISVMAAKRIKENGHPRGFLGHKHTPKSLEIIAKKSKQAWERKTEDELNAHSLRVANNGRKAAMNRAGASWKAGWREIGGVRKYYRSKWEANYAMYLQFLLENGQIKKWEHEPKTFWFEKIKRGCLSYLPDFRVTNNDGSLEYHEVKGWMDDRSKTKLKRMAKYYPEVKILLIQKKQYNEILAETKAIINYE